MRAALAASPGPLRADPLLIPPPRSRLCDGLCIWLPHAPHAAPHAALRRGAGPGGGADARNGAAPGGGWGRPSRAGAGQPAGRLTAGRTASAPGHPLTLPRPLPRPPLFQGLPRLLGHLQPLQGLGRRRRRGHGAVRCREEQVVRPGGVGMHGTASLGQARRGRAATGPTTSSPTHPPCFTQPAAPCPATQPPPPEGTSRSRPSPRAPLTASGRRSRSSSMPPCLPTPALRPSTSSSGGPAAGTRQRRALGQPVGSPGVCAFPHAFTLASRLIPPSPPSPSTPPPSPQLRHPAVGDGQPRRAVAHAVAAAHHLRHTHGQAPRADRRVPPAVPRHQGRPGATLYFGGRGQVMEAALA
jgi:hypothetical protein